MVFMVGKVLLPSIILLVNFHQIYYKNHLLNRNCYLGFTASCDNTPDVYVAHRLLYCSDKRTRGVDNGVVFLHERQLIPRAQPSLRLNSSRQRA